VTGVDFNGAVVEEGRRRAASTEEPATFVVGDMRTLDFSDEFDRAFCFFGSFGYFDEAGDRAMVEGVYRALKTNGKFLIDGHVFESLLPIYRERDWHWVEGEGGRTERMLQDRRFDLQTSRVEADWTWIHDGKEATLHSSMRIYSYRELCRLLSSVGFQSFEGFETKTGEAFKVGCRRLSLVASK
jgi:hypothetical protein